VKNRRIEEKYILVACEKVELHPQIKKAFMTKGWLEGYVDY
jgi:hypothetical protein